MYYLLDVDGKENKQGKGINRVITKNIKHTEYLDILFSSKIIRHKMERIQSKQHKTGTYDVHKISLSCFDDKKYMLDDGINNLTYFHKDTF